MVSWGIKVSSTHDPPKPHHSRYTLPLRRRFLVLVLVLGGIVLALFIPQLPPVRNALLEWGVSALARYGYQVSYQGSAGNLLYNLKLTGLTATGPGVDAAVDTLRVGYTLPALLTGRLPLRAEVSGVTGTLDLNALPKAPPSAKPAEAGRRPFRVRPVLERVDVSDVTLRVRGAPYDVPEVTVTTANVRQQGDALTFDTALAVKDAGAEVSGRATLAPLGVDATVRRADVALAESFFDGAEGGTLSGTVRADGEGVEADLELQDGEVALVGLDVGGVSGPVRVRDSKLTTELRGRALGGPVSGRGTVDFGAQRWQADVTGKAGLAEALGWLGRGRLSPELIETALAPSGEADVSLSVGGWRRFSLSGTAAGRGELLGEPLTDLGVDFGFETDVGTTATAAARLGGAPLEFKLTPQGDGFKIAADGTDLPLRGFWGDVSVRLEGQGSALTGKAEVNLSGAALGRSVRLGATATTDGEAWRFGVSGRDARGARASGGLVLRGGTLGGAVRVRGLELPGLAGPVNLTALAEGPLSELPLTLRATGPGGVHPTTGGVRAGADFSGETTATLKNGTLGGLRGDFGPLSLSGTLHDLRYTLAPTELSGRASGRVALRDGRLTRKDGQLETAATLSTTDLEGAGVRLPDLNAPLSLSRGNGLSASVRDPDAGVDLELRDGDLTGTFRGARVGALGDTFAVTGDVSGRADALSDTLSLDLRAETPGSGPGTTLRATGDARRTRLSLRSEKGATLAGRTLGGALELSGDASLAQRSTKLSGTLGGVGIEVEAEPDVSGRIAAQAGLRVGGNTFKADFETLERWSTDGTLPLKELGDALGVPLSGALRTTLARRGARFSGQAVLQGRAFGVPLTADATTQGDALTLEATSTLLGQPLTLSGQALPETDATLQIGEYGALALSGLYPALEVTGSGLVPGLTRAGLSVAPQRWRADGSLAAGSARLRIGESVVRAIRGENGWQLVAQVKQGAQWRGKPLALAAELTRSLRNPDGRVRGTLALDGAPLTLAGTLRDLNVTGTLPAEAVQDGLLGQLGVDLNADAFARSFDLATRWRRPDGSQALLLQADGARGQVTASAQAAGLNARFGTQGGTAWRVEAERFALSGLPVRTLQTLNARLNGTLSSRNGYRGRLQLSSDLGAAQLTGTGKGLDVTTRVERGALRAGASGSVAPDLGVNLQAAAGDAVSLKGSLTGSVAQPLLRATLRTAAQNLGGGQLTVPARRLELRASLRGGLSASLTGQGVDVQLQEGRWQGPLAVPFTLRGEPHRLAGTLRGALTEPVVAADLNGRTLRGPLMLDRGGLQGDVTVTPNLSAAPDAQMQVGLNATPDRRWQLDLDGSATLPYRALPATLRGRITGEGVGYGGDGTLRVAGEPLPLTVSGEGGRVQARATVQKLRLRPLVPATGTVSGDVRVEANGSLRYFASLRSVGRAAGRPFDLTLSADRGTGLSLGGSAAGAKLTLTGPLPLKTLNLTLADSRRPLELSASLALGRTLTVQGAGGWRGEALAVSGAYTPSLQNGNLALSVGDAALTATVQGAAAGRTVKAALSAPTGLLSLKTPLRADLRLSQGGGALAIENLDARLGPATLSVAGAVQPQADVSGTLNIPAAGAPIALRLTSLETGYLAALTQEALELRGVLKPNFIPERVRLEGALSRSEGFLNSDLVWQEGAGFSGRADLTLTPMKTGAATLALRGEATGEGGAGDLRVRGAAHYRKARLGTLAARLSAEPWRDRRVYGGLTIDAPLDRLVPAWPGKPLRLSGDLNLSGDLTAPQLSGPLALRGALTASGQLRADRTGAEVSLTGPGLSAVASAERGGGRGTLSLSALDLSGVLPRLATSTLSGALRATQTWGEPPQVQLSDLRFLGGESRVSGRARLGDALAGALELDILLSDFSPGLRGRLAGSLTANPRVPLGGTLSLRDVGPVAADWGLGGVVGVSGSVTDPEVRASLAGTGSARGTVRAIFAPRRGQLELTSDLTLPGAEADLTLTRTRASVSAAGTFRYREFAALLRTEGQRVRLVGERRLRGWRGDYGLTTFSLRGPLGSLSPQLSGRLELTGAGDFSAISGALTDAVFGPVALGQVALAGRARQLTLRGDALAAKVRLSGSLPWTLSRLELKGPGNATLTASGEGSRRRGRVSGAVRAASVKVPITARYAPGEIVLEGSGALPVGRLDLRARYRDLWQGYLNVTDEDGVVLSSTLSGAFSAPRLAGRLDFVRGENKARGTFALGRDTVRLGAEFRSPQLEGPLRVTGAGWPLDLTLATPESALELGVRKGKLTASGVLTLSAGPADLTLRAAENGLRLLGSVPALPGLTLGTTLPDDLSAYAALTDGVRFAGMQRASGTLTLRLRPTPVVVADALRWRSAAGTLTLTGSGRRDELFSGTVQGRWWGSGDAALPWLRGADVPFTVRAEGGRFSATSASALGRTEAHFDDDAGRLTLKSDLTLGRGRAAVDVSYTRAGGPTGSVDLYSVPVFTFAEDVATLDTQVSLSANGVSGTGSLALAGGQAELSGQAGWAQLLPEPVQRLTPEGGDALDAQVRFDRFELGGVPPLAARFPYLEAPVSGVATLTGAQIVGQFVAPELRVLATTLPTQLEFNGTPRALDARATFGDSRFSVRYSRETAPRLAGLVTLERFPLHLLAEAAVGASQVGAAVTGAARFDVPLSDPSASYVRLATERLTLTNTGAGSLGKTTQGDVALRFENGSLYVERAEFRGEGFWRASGILTPGELDFALEARNADFTPLLSLAPQLAAFGVGARGSLDLRAAGSASAPDITLTSPRLDVSVAGSRYRALGTQASLSGGAFGLEGELVGVAPVTGRLELRGGGQVNLAPFVTSGLALRFTGAANVPTVGAVTDIRGRIFPARGVWRLHSTGNLGRPFSVSGRLAPLDLTLRGQDLNVQARRLFVSESTTDVNLNLRSQAGGFRIAGDAFVEQARLSLDRSGARAATPPGSTRQAAQRPAQGRGSAVAAIGSALRRTTNPVLERIRFANVRLRAPREVIFQEAFGNAELGLDLTLSGTAAEPLLSGEAQTLRGSIRFSGQDFTLTRAVATFDPAQGAYPTLAIEALATFDQERALGRSAAAEGDPAALTFIEPSDSSLFDVRLSITGSFEEGLGGRRALDLKPTLTSSAVVQETGGTPRPLSEAELVALLTLGRLQLDAPIVGSNSLAGTVAESALDNLVDLLLVSELQDALGEVLGVDLLEIRTSALSTFLGTDGQTENFGVSVRVGGYLNDNLFASVQVGRYDDPDQDYALSNEFSLRYTAAPLELNLSGGVNFLDQSTLSAVTDFSLGLSYAVTPLISLDASLATTALGRDTRVGFGVSFTW